jgi:hypothetical protein
VPQSKYAELLAIIEELGKEIRPTYAGSKSAMERLKRGELWAGASHRLASSPSLPCLLPSSFPLLPSPSLSSLALGIEPGASCMLGKALYHGAAS